MPEKFVALDPNADVLWPGSLVQGKSMAGGILDPVPVKRAPGTITLTLASGGGGPFFKTMPEPSLSAATQAQNEILAAYTGKTPAKFSYSFESIYSSEQLAVAVDGNVEGTNWSAAASLSVDLVHDPSPHGRLAGEARPHHRLHREGPAFRRPPAATTSSTPARSSTSAACAAATAPPAMRAARGPSSPRPATART